MGHTRVRFRGGPFQCHGTFVSYQREKTTSEQEGTMLRQQTFCEPSEDKLQTRKESFQCSKPFVSHASSGVSSLNPFVAPDMLLEHFREKNHNSQTNSKTVPQKNHHPYGTLGGVIELKNSRNMEGGSIQTHLLPCRGDLLETPFHG